MTARDAIDKVNRLNRSRSQIRGEMPDRTPLDYPLGRVDIADTPAPPDEDDVVPAAARPTTWDKPAMALIGLMALAGLIGIFGCWPHGATP